MHLDDDDTFHVYGNGDHDISKLRLIGGQNNDTYNIEQWQACYLSTIINPKKNTVVTKKGQEKVYR